MVCKICGSKTTFFDTALVLGKYNIKYYKCPCCGFIQTEKPYWHDEAYSSAITSSDVGLIQRNITLSRKLDIFFRFNLSKETTFLDYGGGYGMLVRLMRDKGYDFEWYDEYCENLFAKNHEMSKQHYDVITAFEMLEHLTDPMTVLDNFFSLGNTIICSTDLIPSEINKVNEWSYFGVEHGQHVSFFSEHSMEIIANKFNRCYYSLSGLHVFTDKITSLRRVKTRLFIHFPFSEYFIGNKRKSLLGYDYEQLTGNSL